MKQLGYKYLVESHTADVRLDRLGQVELRFFIKNIGSKGWIDSKKKKLISQGSEPISLRPLDGRNLEDIDITFTKDGRTDTGFFDVMDSSDKHKAKPGQTIELRACLRVKKFALSGKRIVNFSLYLGHTQISGSRIAVKISISSTEKRIKKPFFIGIPSNDTYLNPLWSGSSKRHTVIIANWRRTDNVLSLIETIGAQSVPCRLVIWDNSGQPNQLIKVSKNAQVPVKVHTSSKNIGGFGRFYAARLLDLEDHGPVTFIDDDQELKKTSIAQLIANYRSNSIGSFWSFKFTDKYNYWHKKRVDRTELPDYLGTGGMTVDSNIFKEPFLYKCPRRYWFVEDLWLSYVAVYRLGWEPYSIDADIKMEEDGKNQTGGLIDTKTYFYRYLQKKGAFSDV